MSNIVSSTEKCFVVGYSGVYITKVIKVIERRNGKKINVTESTCFIEKLSLRTKHTIQRWD